MVTSIQKISNVYITNDYSIFKTIEGNRIVNTLHVERLKRSMSEKHLVSPIIVNENYEIIDGQHRFLSSKESNLPIYFILCTGYGLDEVHRLNCNNNIWNLRDFLNGYCLMGNENYKKLKDFCEINNITVNTCLFLISCLYNISHKYINTRFKKGTLEISNLNLVQNFLDSINAFNSFKEYKSSVFIRAFLKLYTSPKYNHSNMLSKLDYRKGELQKRSTVNQYIDIICDIYNTRLSMNNKIFFDNGKEII